MVTTSRNWPQHSLSAMMETQSAATVAAAHAKRKLDGPVPEVPRQLLIHAHKSAETATTLMSEVVPLERCAMMETN
jgi:hypothetical protein